MILIDYLSINHHEKFHCAYNCSKVNIISKLEAKPIKNGENRQFRLLLHSYSTYFSLFRRTYPSSFFEKLFIIICYHLPYVLKTPQTSENLDFFKGTYRTICMCQGHMTGNDLYIRHRGGLKD